MRDTDFMSSIVHFSGYKFTPLSNLPDLKEELLAFCREKSLCGTILLSPEGINFYVAGAAESGEALLLKLRTCAGLGDLAAKRSSSARRPYDRMMVKIKREIIAFGDEQIDPARHTSPKLSAGELKQWLDEGRDVTLLDTRNDYEVHLGTFRNAVPAGIDHFRDFPEAVRRLPAEWKTKPIVMFCTGGIRCEKAGPCMEREGFRHVFQLDGGILRYFEECGAAHFEGECFVFDQRVGLDPALKETQSILCARCQMPLASEEQAHPHFVAGKSCPHCHGRVTSPA